jgi:PAS domain S-box-containing protein
MSWLLQSRGFLRSPPGRGFVVYLLLAALLSAGIGVAFSEAKLTWFKTQKGEEKATALRLVDAFVTSYSKVRSQYLSGDAPVPATFRAHAIALFEEARPSQESLHLRMVGFPGREIATPPADEAMAATIRGFLGQVKPEPETRFLTVNGATVLRTVYPSIASQQSCVDCHNKLQPRGPGWQLNDVMGAFVAEVPVGPFLRKAAFTAAAVTIVLLIISGALGLYFFHQHFAQLRRHETDQVHLTDSERKFRTLVSNIPGACYRAAHDLDFTMAFISDAVEDISGYPARDFIGNRARSFVNVIHPDDRDMVERVASEAIVAHRPYTIDYRLMHRDGSIRWVHEKGQGVFDNAGQLQHLDGAIFDISERRQMEEELRRALEDLRAATDRLAQQERFATIGQVAATVSHELRNPLSVVRNSLETVRGMAAGATPSIERPLERADRGIERCTRIIYDLLAFSQNRDLNREPASIDALTGDALDACSLVDGIVVERNLRSRSEVAIDREAFRQVVVRLVDNAVQALRDPAWSKSADHTRRITVSTEAGGPHVRLPVIDTGPGIPPEVLPKVFEPLFTTKSFGVGLGLPTVRQIVELHGGGIDIESKVGQGTTVRIWLPCLGHQTWTPAAAEIA